MKLKIVLALGAAAVALWCASTWAADANALYQTHCASCHGADRLGGAGPALLPGNLDRLRRPDAIKTISDGRMATQMPAFSGKLSADEIKRRLAELRTTHQNATGPAPAARGYRKLFLDHVTQADLGCDFDFLRAREMKSRSPIGR